MVKGRTSFENQDFPADARIAGRRKSLACQPGRVRRDRPQGQETVVNGRRMRDVRFSAANIGKTAVIFHI